MGVIVNVLKFIGLNILMQSTGLLCKNKEYSKCNYAQMQSCEM